jgi:signal transduction histidine kinase/ActR/RegA family two-component response regulator
MMESLERVKSQLVPDMMAVQRYDVRQSEEQGGEYVTRYWSVLNTPVVGEDGQLRVIIERAEDVTEFVFLTQAAGVDTSQAIDEQVRRSQVEIVRRADELQTLNKELRAANAAKNEFLSRMSHELRTPLTAILGFGELLALSDLNPDDREAVTVIRRAGDHLLQLVNEVLDLARIEAGELSISVESVNPREIVEEARRMMAPLAQRAEVEITTTANGVSQSVLADHQRLKQVLINLISNGVKFNRRGGKVIVELQVANERDLQISVTDTGRGVDAAALERLFIPFDRLDAEREGIDGTGIGLALSKNLVQLMHGTLDVESEPGTGSTFTLRLPICEPVAVGDGADPTHAALEVHRFDGERRVLYIEDKLANIQLVETVMRRRPDVQLTTAMLGDTGIELARSLRPHLIMLDVHLPDMEGPEVLKRIRALDELANTQVIILSADATMMHRDELANLGARRYLTKPISLEGFLKVVDECLESVGQAAV